MLWLVWIVYFFVLETVTLLAGTNQELTEHLRPVFLSAPLTWFIGVGVWLWLGVHFFAPSIESMLNRINTGGV
jgi:hypothetical protein